MVATAARLFFLTAVGIAIATRLFKFHEISVSNTSSSFVSSIHSFAWKWTWMQKFIYMFPLLPTGDQTKLLKFFWLKIFFICHRCRWHRWQTLSCEYFREFSKKFGTVLMEYSGTGGKLIHEKNQKQKISLHCPFNALICSVFYLFSMLRIISIPYNSRYTHTYCLWI
jgi:hypothetical protein